MRTRGIITAALLITTILGTLNSIIKHDKLPGFRFYFGSGILYLMLSAMAEWEDELAKSIAIAITTFVVLGEGGGVLDHFLGKGASSSILNTTPGKTPAPGNAAAGAAAGASLGTVETRRNTGKNAVNVTAPSMPILPHTPAFSVPVITN